MKYKPLKMLLISVIALISFSCMATLPTPATTNVVQFAKVEKPAKIGNLGSFPFIGTRMGPAICFPEAKAKLLLLYIDKQDEAIDAANVTIDNANVYIKQLSK